MPPPRRASSSACCAGKVFLLAVTLAVFVGNALASPYFLDIWNLSDATFNFTEKAIIVLPMAMLIIAREIDLSVASTIALSSTVMGFCAAAGLDTPLLVCVGLGVGLLCGAVQRPAGDPL
ncbi:Autoinducer 2 import system permease protein lsrD [Leclercia adecarboxylata]|uniref:Autoinducer 2 import system permease protein lsrD n=1 Tax=Leclercia adecarboxylata TaxID=83655 RepID=A0A4U9IXP8_9ENTR|nr:Autoinducer 2 import system permease protein lsrD [Leclercia adecarboxylata]